MWFHKKKKHEVKSYDHEHLRPVIRASICTGEQTAGFQDLRTGQFREVMLIRTEADLEEFQETYGVTDLETIY